MSDPGNQTAGCVWMGEFDFYGTGHGRLKYFVLLNHCEKSTDHFVVAITTSNEDRYPGQYTGSPCGCPQFNCFRIDPGQEACFPKTTWVQFDNVLSLQPQRFKDVIQAGAAFVHRLAPDRTRSLLSCAKKSRDLTGRDLQLIAATLKALQAKAKAAGPN